MDTAQYLIVGLAIVTAVSYLAWRLWQSLSGEGDPCAGCDGCALKDARRRKGCSQKSPMTMDSKKKEEKFGDKE